MRRGTGSKLAGMLAAIATLACIVIAPATAAAAPEVDGVFDLTGKPIYLAEAADGTIWMTLTDSGANNDMARISPAGVVNEFDVPNVSNPKGIAAGPDGNLWVTQLNEVVRVPPNDPSLAQNFAVNLIPDPRGIVTGPDGNLWTASGGNVLRIPTADPTTFDDFPVAGLDARGISAGSELIWVADASGRVVSLNTAGADQTPYVVGGGVQEVAATTETDQVAYSNPLANPQTIGRITPPGDALTSPTPMKDPFGVTYANDEAWWFAQFASSTLGRLTIDGTYTELQGLPAASGPRYLTTGPDDTLWVGLEISKQVARVTGVEAPAPPAAPQTTIDKAPKTVKAGRKGAKATFKFSSPTAGAGFECALKRKGKKNGKEKKLAKFATCSSPKKYKKLRKGTYTFAVRATAMGDSDPTPAEAKLKVKKKKGKGKKKG